MKTGFATLLFLATLNLTFANTRAAQSPAPVAQLGAGATVSPKVVADRTPLSAEEMAKYQEKAADSKQAANDKTAGASDDKSVWIIVGVIVIVAITAVVASGGHGGGGGY